MKRTLNLTPINYWTEQPFIDRALASHNSGGSNIVADVTVDIGAGLAANLKTYDLSQITLGAQKVFGANYVGGNVLNDIYVDGVHETTRGKRLLVSGGDTPANGILANV